MMGKGAAVQGVHHLVLPWAPESSPALHRDMEVLTYVLLVKIRIYCISKDPLLFPSS